MARSTTLRRLQALIWVLIFGGLLGVVYGLSLQRYQPGSGLAFIAGGVLAAAIGVVLIFVRAGLRDDGVPPA